MNQSSMQVRVLCMTYHQNHDILDDFLHHYNKHCNLPLTFITDKPIDNLKKANVINYKDNFSSRLIFGLKKIEEDFVILVLDDYFFLKIVDNEVIFELCDELKNNQELSYIKLVYESGFKNRLINDQFLYSLSLCAGLWKKKDLFQILRPSENAHQLEIFGSFRFYFGKKFFKRQSNGV